jgi:glycosyltransferase involved in cell wall biosynthesis
LRWQLCDILVQEEIDLILCSIPGTRDEAPLLDAAIREAGRGCILLRLGVSPGTGWLSAERIGLHLDTVRGVVVVSEEIKSRLLVEFPSLPEDQIHVIYNGVDVDTFAPETISSEARQAFRASLDIPEHNTVIGTVGRLDRIKNLPMLVRAAGRVVEHFPDTTFVIAGEGAEKQGLIDAVQKADLLDYFRFPGFVEDTPCLLHSIDILTHTSLSEGVPNAVLEAMAMGKAVVATEVGGVPELIEDGVTGVLIPSNDDEKLAWTLCNLLQHPAKRTFLGRAARHQAETTLNRQAKLEALEGLFESEVDQARAVGVPEPGAPVDLYDLPDLFIKRPFAMR